MKVKTGHGLYTINLIRDLREKEIKVERQSRLLRIFGLGCFGFFLLSLLYSGLTIWQMEQVLELEKDKLSRLNLEYQKYTAARLIVEKSDLELLNDLQGKGVFWTRKLASMAKHLPENYWITSFAFKDEELKVSGYGYASQQQDQLLVLDQYLNRLRSDTSFADTFHKMQLNIAERRQDAAHIAFDFSAYTKKWKGQ
jgi:hypothetical protein